MSILTFSGQDERIDITITGDDGNPVNIDNLVELYIAIADKQGNILVEYNKAGTGDYVAIIRDSSTEYHLWLDSSITKNIRKNTLKIAGNYVETETELTDNIKNTLFYQDLFNIVWNPANKYS